MTISVYPRERLAILRIARAQKLRSLFDVVRMLADGNPNSAIKPTDFSPPRFKS